MLRYYIVNLTACVVNLCFLTVQYVPNFTSGVWIHNNVTSGCQNIHIIRVYMFTNIHTFIRNNNNSNTITIIRKHNSNKHLIPLFLFLVKHRTAPKISLIHRHFPSKKITQTCSYFMRFESVVLCQSANRHRSRYNRLAFPLLLYISVSLYFSYEFVITM